MTNTICALSELNSVLLEGQIESFSSRSLSKKERIFVTLLNRRRSNQEGKEIVATNRVLVDVTDSRNLNPTTHVNRVIRVVGRFHCHGRERPLIVADHVEVRPNSQEPCK